MDFYCVLTLSPDVSYVFYLKLVKNAKIGNFWRYPHPNLATLWNLVILGFWPFPQHCKMVQIQNHQKLVKNAKISDFWGKFTPKSGDAFKFEYKKGFFTSKWSTIVTKAAVVLNSVTRWFKTKIAKNRQWNSQYCQFNV